MTSTIDEIVVGDEPDCWRDAGFTVDDDGTCRLGHVRVRLVGRDGGKRIRDWSLRDIDAAALVDGALDGLRHAGEHRGPVRAGHPPQRRRCSSTTSCWPPPIPLRTTAAFEAAGLPARRTRLTDTYGSPLLQTFFRAGEVIIELIGPQEAAGDGPTAFFGLAHTVADLDATAVGPRTGASARRRTRCSRAGASRRCATATSTCRCPPRSCRPIRPAPPAAPTTTAATPGAAPAPSPR